MSKRRNRAAGYSGMILDEPTGQEHLSELTILERASLTPAQRRGPVGPICCCRPLEANRLGGQRPMLRWSSAAALQAYCATCQRPLDSTHHRRRAAQHVLGLARLPLEVIDLADCVAAGLMLPEHLERPVADVADNVVEMSGTFHGKTSALARGRAGGGLSAEELEQLRELMVEPDWEALSAEMDLSTLLGRM